MTAGGVFLGYLNVVRMYVAKGTCAVPYLL